MLELEKVRLGYSPKLYSIHKEGQRIHHSSIIMDIYCVLNDVKLLSTAEMVM
jgi:hypothetical protein